MNTIAEFLLFREVQQPVVEGIRDPESAFSIIARLVGTVDDGRSWGIIKCFARSWRRAGEEVNGLLFHLVEPQGVVVVVADHDISVGVETDFIKSYFTEERVTR